MNFNSYTMLKHGTYNWYHKITKEDNSVSVELELGESKEGTSYDFTAEEMNSEFSKFNQMFIVPEIDKSPVIEIGDIHNIDTDKVWEVVNLAIKKLKNNEELITEEIKTATESKLAEIESNKDAIKVAEEEKAKTEAEEQAKQETEANKSSQERTTNNETSQNSSNILKVGNYTIKYGTYVGYETLYDPSGNETVKHTVVINQDGTLTYNGNTSKYTVSGNYIKGNSGMPFQVTGNNQFTLEAGGGVNFTYQG